MKSLTTVNQLGITAMLVLLVIAFPAGAQEQEATEPMLEAEQRQQRIRELRQLLREDHAARREAIQAKLDTLTDEQKAALQERRQLQRRARSSRMARGAWNDINRCPCPDSSAQDSEP